MALRAGAIRFNTDSSQMEIYDGNQWTGILATSPEQQTGGTRGLIMGGIISGRSNVVDYITISTTGNSADFGDLTSVRYNSGGASSPTRALFLAG